MILQQLKATIYFAREISISVNVTVPPLYFLPHQQVWFLQHQKPTYIPLEKFQFLSMFYGSIVLFPDTLRSVILTKSAFNFNARYKFSYFLSRCI